MALKSSRRTKENQTRLRKGVSKIIVDVRWTHFFPSRAGSAPKRIQIFLPEALFSSIVIPIILYPAKMPEESALFFHSLQIKPDTVVYKLKVLLRIILFLKCSTKQQTTWTKNWKIRQVSRKYLLHDWNSSSALSQSFW